MKGLRKIFETVKWVSYNGCPRDNGAVLICISLSHCFS